MVDTHPDNEQDAVARFRAIAEAEPNASTRRGLCQTIDAFSRFAGGADIALGDIDQALAGRWASWLLGAGYTLGTATYYVNRLSALYGKSLRDSGLKPAPAFSAVRQRLKEADTPAFVTATAPGMFAALRGVVLADRPGDPARQLARDILLFSLYNGGLSYERLARYRKDEYAGSEPAVLDIVARYARPRNKYLFPLRQGERTPAQLLREVTALFRDALRGAGVVLADCPPELPLHLWTALAARCGVTPAEMAACLPQGYSNPLCCFATPGELTPAEQEEVRGRVARILARDPEEWFAMQFRPHVDLDRLERRFADCDITLSATFYPMREIVRRVGGRLRKETRPVVPGLFFFRSKASALPALFCRIGDLAWGYRSSRSTPGAYAVIPRASIEAYQRALGEFVDCIESCPDGTLAFEKGDRVEITGGLYAGYPAVVEKELRPAKDGDKVVYRLRLAGVESYTWTVDTDPRLMTKAASR